MTRNPTICQCWLWAEAQSLPQHLCTSLLHTYLKGPRAIMCFKKKAMVSGQVMLLYSSYSSLTRAVGVSRRWRDNGGDLSDLSASIVACHIINVHIWEKPRPLPSSSVIFSAGLSLCALLCFISQRSSGAVFALLNMRVCTEETQHILTFSLCDSVLFEKYSFLMNCFVAQTF